MRSFESEIEALRSQSLHRRLRVLDSAQGAAITLAEKCGEALNFSSNDYLGLANTEALREAMIEGVRRFGAGSGASRLVCGTLSPHVALEAAIADFKSAEAAVAFGSGFAAATGALPALLGKGDAILLDKLSHASLIDGARLSGATIRVFPHNDLGKLEALLGWARRTLAGDARVIVATEAIFSMDGDRAPLREIAGLKDRFGALLLVDEAHAIGVCGPGGRGLAAELVCGDRVDLKMGTLSKALGCSGGYLAGSAALIDLLINRARSFIYSTAPPPAVAFAARRAIEISASPDGDARRARLWQNLRAFAAALDLPDPQSAIVPIIAGREEAALAAAAKLLEGGILAPAIRFPTVARGSARLRLSFSAAHTPGQVSALADAIRGLALG